VDNKFIKSFERSLEHYKSGQPIEAIRILVPQFEELTNVSLKNADIDFSSARGLADKFKLLSIDDPSLSIIRSIRNMFAHGAERAEEIQLYIPLYQFIVSYIVKLVDILSHPPKPKGKG
jgi:hypothetical protein